MAYTPEKRREALHLLDEGFSLSEAARMANIPVPTLMRWRDKQDSVDSDTEGLEPEGQSIPTEADVTGELLNKSRVLLLGIDGAGMTPQNQSFVAGAIDKLLTKYLALTGKVTESHVTVSHAEASDWADLLKAVSPAKENESA